MADEDRFRVPEGFRVTTGRVPPLAGVSSSASGIVEAHFGYTGDDYEAARDVVKQVGRAVHAMKGVPPVVQFVSGSGQISELCGPTAPASRAVHGAIVWTAFDDGLCAMLAEPSERRWLSEQLQRFSRFEQVLLCTSQDDAVFGQLQRLGLLVARAKPQEPFIVEVQRPDGDYVVAFVSSPVAEQPLSELPASARPLQFAPRLYRSLLDVGAGTLSVAALCEQLSKRPYPLLFPVAGETPGLVQWPNIHQPMLPVFADVASVVRMLNDTAQQTRCNSFGALSVGQLGAWASAQRFGLALGFYPANGAVRYLPITLTAAA